MKIYYHANSDVLIWAFTDIDTAQFTDETLHLDPSLLTDSSVYDLLDDQQHIVGIQFEFFEPEGLQVFPHLLTYIEEWVTTQEVFTLNVTMNPSGFLLYRSPFTTREKLPEIIIFYDDLNQIIGFEQLNVSFPLTRWKYQYFSITHLRSSYPTDITPAYDNNFTVPSTFNAHYDDDTQSLHIDFCNETQYTERNIQFLECTGLVLLDAQEKVVGVTIYPPDFINHDHLALIADSHASIQLQADIGALLLCISPPHTQYATNNIMLQVSPNWSILTCVIFDELDDTDRYELIINHMTDKDTSAATPVYTFSEESAEISAHSHNPFIPVTRSSEEHVMTKLLATNNRSKNPATIMLDDSTMDLLTKRAGIIQQYHSAHYAAVNTAQKAENLHNTVTNMAIPNLTEGPPTAEISSAQQKVQELEKEISTFRSRIEFCDNEIQNINTSNTYFMIGIVVLAIILFFNII